MAHCSHPFFMAVVQCKELFSIIASDYLKTLFFLS